MEVKRNEPTELRPQGGRVMDAPVVPINVPEFLRQIKNEPAWENSDRNAMTVFKSEEMRIVLTALHKDAVIEQHKANGVISVQVLEGENAIAKNRDIMGATNPANADAGTINRTKLHRRSNGPPQPRHLTAVNAPIMAGVFPRPIHRRFSRAPAMAAISRRA